MVARVSAKPVSILWVDIAGSTALRAKVGNEEAFARIGSLVEKLGTIVQKNGGQVLKNDGDDLLVVFDGPDHATSAVMAAAECQVATRERAMSLYAGVSTGAALLKEVFGRRDVDGMCVNVAARLHKLIPDKAGVVYLDDATYGELSADTQSLCNAFGSRELKGVGPVDVYTLEWDDVRTHTPTMMAGHSRHLGSQDLVLSAGRLRESYAPERKVVTLGRSSKCDIRLTHEHISGQHVEFRWEGGKWSVRDTSKNGTWARMAGPASELQLPMGIAVPLAPAGAICLGQPFEKDRVQGATTVEFELIERP